MKFFNFLFTALFGLMLLSCGSDTSTTNQTPASETPVTEGMPSVAAPQSGTPLSTGGDVKLNPAHGEPGHRCDIAVGAPLDGSAAAAPAAAQSPVIQTQVPPPAATTPVQTTTTTTVAEGMNPPHGQPGHRCDIAVGAPLNSKAAQ